jgi:uncharacterized protein YjdB
MSTSADGATMTCSPSKALAGGNAVVKVTATDCYGRQVTRTITVVMDKYVVTGISLSQSDYTTTTKTGAKQINAILSSDSGSVSDLSYTDVTWSSSNEAVATVDSTGLVTPIDSGTAVITAKSFDGGYSASLTVTVVADFTELISKTAEYTELIESVKDTYEYTPDSLDALSEVVAESKTMISESKATQAQIDDMLSRLEQAYNSLVKYVMVESVSLTLGDTESTATQPNENYYRYTGTILANATISLKTVCAPEGSFYDTVEWSSSNSDITVDANGLVKSTTNTSKTAVITCTVTNVNGSTCTTKTNVSFVRVAVTGIAFDESTIYHGGAGATATLKPTISYSGATVLDTLYVSKCAWSSSDESIATVDENGVVTFVSSGQAEITATTLDGGYSASTVVYTTNDTSALKEAIDSASSINYTNYAYSYGTAFKSAYENAQAVYDDLYASQSTIDSACTALTEAVSNLEGNEFVVPVPAIAVNGEAVSNGTAVEANDNSQVVLVAQFNDGAMVKSYSWSYDEDSLTGLSATVNSSNQLVLTKSEETGSATVTLTVVDDYDREYTVTRTINVLDKVVKLDSIAITVNGEAVTNHAYTVSCGGNYSNFGDVTIGYIPTPENANTIESVAYSVSGLGSAVIKVDSQTGAVSLSNAISYVSSYNATITCTVTNTDGTTATDYVALTVTKK